MGGRLKKKHKFTKGFKRTQGFYSKRQSGAEKPCAPINLHEQSAEAILLELRDKYEVFDFVLRKHSMDQVGIDWVLGKYVHVKKRMRDLRIHIQHKASEKDAAYFRDLNPCIPVWVHHHDTTVLDGKIHLLRLVVQVMQKTSSSHVDFFVKKLQQLEGEKRLAK
ncbi:hypothetical protein A2926_01675 [Candidatus Giovannonibacteria bacterium RIFCSPLOWO2_01_FULL_44_40]|uniref:Uncharacterized protein n=1 Tax=Candidatus Giovannonibacteria bacterium RIFCSPHIGHO2_01_FULL_45_23 TaxID=1798325 RepID=A0A1F5VF24_9BACT|nr:MAG: hypothetical protein A2834_01865 [Candidatus Giovannonibacteria bacterium RIFCSPHIGHO2_01_FULL_45_23]OGF75050.1 MAG: hypothetical protein A3C77_03965 [Candidatus Giovannonibacteria bacterium RIFCSPHIGHO2_02_FULL_45_13]OGF79873.1 MAG: hypothetical protein A2926_01675 [Candidatus Giovannonibacteria bacterium RIFCSPLOWO2_01_FULL_44_40]